MIESLSNRLRQAGYKLTAPRLAVIEVIETSQKHLNHSETLKRGRAIHPALSRATVYRTLDILIDLGVLRPVHLGDGDTRFARVDGGHHHLVCLSCGAAIHFDECLVEELKQELSERLNFKIQSHLLELYGLCKECQE